MLWGRDVELNNNTHAAGLLHSTGNFTNIPTMTYLGKESEKVYIYVFVSTESFCCTYEKKQPFRAAIIQYKIEK